jgi:hypothetical protein
LWTVEEGRPDLTLELRLTDTGGELYYTEKIYDRLRGERGWSFLAL